MRQYKALFGAALTLLLVACSSPQYLVSPASVPEVGGVKQTFDGVKDSVKLQPLRWGSFLFPAKGSFFKPLVPTDSRNAIVYVYRSASDWNDGEVQAPGFFLNGQFISGLKSGSYFWFEVPASTYHFHAKRPLALVYLFTIFEADLNLEGGKSYYFRYDEERPGPEKPAKGAALLVVGPLIQVPESQGIQEIGLTRFTGDGKVLLADAQPPWTPFDLYTGAAPVQKNSLDATSPKPKEVRTGEEVWAGRDEDNLDDPANSVDDIELSSGRQWWNPATWGRK